MGHLLHPQSALHLMVQDVSRASSLPLAVRKVGCSLPSYDVVLTFPFSFHCAYTGFSQLQWTLVAGPDLAGYVLSQHWVLTEPQEGEGRGTRHESQSVVLGQNLIFLWEFTSFSAGSERVSSEAG